MEYQLAMLSRQSTWLSVCGSGAVWNTQLSTSNGFWEATYPPELRVSNTQVMFASLTEPFQATTGKMWTCRFLGGTDVEHSVK